MVSKCSVVLLLDMWMMKLKIAGCCLVNHECHQEIQRMTIRTLDVIDRFHEQVLEVVCQLYLGARE